MPFNAPQQTAQPHPELYTILDAKIQGGMSGSNTLVYLETPQKKQLYAYVRGVRQELTRGTQLCNVKLKTQKQDTVSGCCYCEANVRHVGRDQHENGLQDA